MVEVAENFRESLYGFPVREPDARIRDNPNGRSVDIKRLWSRSQEILSLDSLGHKGADIARMLGIHPVTVSNTLNSTLGKEVQTGLRNDRHEEYEQLRDEVMDLTRISLDVYREALNEPNETGRVSISTKLKVADTVTLELSGLRAPTRIDSRSVHYTATVEEIESFKRRGIDAARANGKIVDIEAESTECEA